MKEEFLLEKNFITLGQFLKEINEIPSGGMAKWYLQEEDILLDGKIERRRGRKLYPKMEVKVPQLGIFIIKEKRTDESQEL